jgi:alpha-N-acetylglucosamine transferase
MREQGLTAKRYIIVALLTVLCMGFIFSSKPYLPTPDAFPTNTTRFALVSLLTVDGPQAWWSQQRYIASAEKLAHSFRKYSPYDMVLLVVDEYGALRKRDELRLRNSGWSVHRLKQGIVPRYEGWNQLYSAKLFSKLWVWRLTMYEQILFTDLDVLFLRPPTQLFHTRVPTQNPGMVLDTMRTSYFNAGIILLRPDEDEYQRLISAMDTAPQNSEFTEQDFLNIFYHGRITRMDASFNKQVCANGDCLNDMTPTEEAFTDNTKILHFTGNNKPWNMQNCVTQRIVQLCLFWKNYG